MNDSKKIVSRLPTRTLLLYIILGGLVCTLLGVAYAWRTDWDRFPETAVLWDAASMLLFFGVALFFLIRSSRSLILYDNRIVRKSILGKRVTYFKDINGHHVDDSSSNSLVNNARGYFRGIIIKKKNGQYFSLNKAELSDFLAVRKHIRHRCRYYKGSAIRKLLKKADRNRLLFVIFLFAVVIMSLMH